MSLSFYDALKEIENYRSTCLRDIVRFSVTRSISLNFRWKTYGNCEMYSPFVPSVRNFLPFVIQRRGISRTQNRKFDVAGFFVQRVCNFFARHIVCTLLVDRE